MLLGTLLRQLVGEPCPGTDRPIDITSYLRLIGRDKPGRKSDFVVHTMRLGNCSNQAILVSKIVVGVIDELEARLDAATCSRRAFIRNANKLSP